jgi:hypothetical protein
MAAYTGAIVLRDCLLTLDDVEFSNQVNRARLVPDTPIQTMRTLVPDGVIQDVDSTVWTLELQGVQDWETGGLAAFLHTNAGQTVEATLAPKNATGKKLFTFNVVCIDPPVGGDQGTFATFEIELPVTGGLTIGTVPA